MNARISLWALLLCHAAIADDWRALPLITAGRIDPAWAQIGWGGFVVDDGALRTECDDRGMGLLLYAKEKFGDCQLRVVYRCEKPKSNAGVYVRLDDGVLGKVGEKSPEVHRDRAGKLSKEMLKMLEDASNKHLGAWYPVHHGYEVQIMDAADEWHRTGAIYSLAKSEPVPPKPQNEWRTMIITLTGECIGVEVDGKRLSTFNAAARDLPPRLKWAEPIRGIKRPTHGYIGLQNHDPGDVVWFKEVRVRALDEKPAEEKPGASASAGRMIRAAAISLVPVKFDLPGNADRLEKAFRSAHDGGAKIAVAPEGVLEGYVVNEIIAGKAKPEAMMDVALAMDDPVIRRFQNLARELKICLVFGFAERIQDEVFNCAAFIDDSGTIRGRHHKMQLAEGSHPDWWFNRLGAQSRAFDTPHGRCGIVICNERWNPQLARILALDGARFLLIPAHGSKSKLQDDAVLLLGRENGVPIVEANVGVTLLVDGGRITAVDRKQEGITFGDITIPPPIAARPDERDHVEREFLAWREQEMKMRYAKTMKLDKTAGTTNSIGMKLVRVRAGEFTMGSPLTEKGRRDDEPQRRVRLTRDFLIGQFEVTRGQFRQFVEATGFKTEAERGLRGGYGYDEATNQLTGPDHRYSWQFTGFPQTDEHPVVNVSWNDANAFCHWLGEREKQSYRLPTEAEWEYACRGGTTTAYANGDDAEKVIELGNIMDALAHERFPDRITVPGRDGFIFTAPVGSFRPNALGLHDMHGNVWEWTADWFAPPPTAQTDPRGPGSGRDKVVRGGDWYHDGSFARSAQRYPIHPGLCRRHAGFRVVRDVSPP